MSQSMDKVDSLLQWAANHGVQLTSITPAPISGRGFGMLATRRIKKGQLVMTIPTAAIRSRSTISATITAKLPADMTLHGLLAAQLLLFPPDSAVWAELVPSPADFERSTPFFWPARLQELLPQEAKKLLRSQQSRAGRDWSMFAAGFPGYTERDYLHSWFLVGTRSFYYETPDTLPYPPHDRLALLPVADMFNHSSSGGAGDCCGVAFSADGGYEVTAGRGYRQGEEVCLSYGAHSNDFLLAEYGFVPSLDDNNNNSSRSSSSSSRSRNPSDRIGLDGVLLARLDGTQQARLRERRLLGDFMLGVGSPPSDRTWIALRALTGAPPRWEAWTAGAEDRRRSLARAREAALPAVLAEFGEAADACRRSIAALLEEEAEEDAGVCSDGDRAAQLNALLRRWDQIYELARSLS